MINNKHANEELPEWIIILHRLLGNKLKELYGIDISNSEVSHFEKEI